MGLLSVPLLPFSIFDSFKYYAFFMTLYLDWNILCIFWFDATILSIVNYLLTLDPDGL